MLGAADMFVMFNDRPEVRAYSSSSPLPSRRPVDRARWLPAANKTVPVDCTRDPTTELAALVAEATTFGFDASDLMPADVGAGTFWTGMIDWVAANGENTEAVFQEIEDSWPSG